MRHDVLNDIPLVVRNDPDTKHLNGIYWLSEQGKAGSALVSFGSVLRVTEPTRVGVHDPKSWSFASKVSSTKATKLSNLTYQFTFDGSSASIVPIVFGCLKVPRWILSFDMELMRCEPHVVWRRRSRLFGIHVSSEDYDVIQVVDGNGNQIRPTFNQFLLQNGRYIYT